jgi:hypothetical protein
MFVSFMPLYILLCDEVLLYFILCMEVIQSLNLNLDQKDLNLYKRKLRLTLLTHLTWPGIRDKA